MVARLDPRERESSPRTRSGRRDPPLLVSRVELDREGGQISRRIVGEDDIASERPTARLPEVRGSAPGGRQQDSRPEVLPWILTWRIAIHPYQTTPAWSHARGDDRHAGRRREPVGTVRIVPLLGLLAREEAGVGEAE